MKVIDDYTDIEIGCRNLQSTHLACHLQEGCCRSFVSLQPSPGMSHDTACLLEYWSMPASPVTPDVSAYTGWQRDLGFFPRVQHGIYHLDRGHLALRNTVLFCS